MQRRLRLAEQFGRKFSQKIKAAWFFDPREDVGMAINQAFLAGYLGQQKATLVLPAGRLTVTDWR